MKLKKQFTLLRLTVFLASQRLDMVNCKTLGMM